MDKIPEEPVKKKRGRKKKTKDETKPVVKKKRGRKKKCEMNLNGEKNTGFIENLSTIDVSDNKIIITGNVDDKNYESINFGCGVTIKKKKKTDITDIQKLKKKLFKEKVEDDDECLIDIEESEPRNKVDEKKDNIDFLSIFSKKKESPKQEKVEETVIKKGKGIRNKYKRPGKRKVRVIHKNGTEKSVQPEKTDLLCWWCSHSFDGPPCFVPTKYDERMQRFKITGNFCTWNCAKAYLLSGNLGVYKNRDLNNFTQMMKRMKLPYKVKAAPRPETLKCFGGILTIDEFRESAFTTDIYNIQTSVIEYDDSINITF